MSCNDDCGNITLFGGKDGNTVHNGQGSPNIGNPNIGDFYIDTDTWEIYGPYNNNSWGNGTSIVGPQGPQGPQGAGIQDIVWESNSNNDPQNTPGTTDIYKVNFDDGSSSTVSIYNGKDGIDANSDYGNTLFVDSVYGNNLGGQRERFDLPYRNISSALSNSQEGDTIIIRSGTYTENISLKNKVNLIFENVVLNGKISTSGANVVSSITGDLKVYSTSGDAFSITGESDININIDYVSSVSTAVYADGRENKVKLKIVLNRISDLNINYAVAIRGNVDASILIKNKIATQDTVDSLAIFDIDYHSGNIDITCPYTFIGDSTDNNSGHLYLQNPSNNVDSFININLGKVVNNYHSAPEPWGKGVIDIQGNSTTVFKVDNMISKDRVGLVVQGNNNGNFKFTGCIISENNVPFQYAASTKTLIENSKFEGRRNPFIESIFIGNPNNANFLVNYVETGYKLMIKDSLVSKYGIDSESGQGGIMNKGGDDNIYLYNVNIYAGGNNIGPTKSIVAETITEGNVYMNNVSSNADIGSNVSDISTGGFTLENTLRIF